MKMSHKFNISFLLLIGMTALYLILGAYGQSAVMYKVELSWVVALLIPLYIAINTKTSILSKGVVCCILVLYIYEGIKHTWNYINRTYCLPVCVPELDAHIREKEKEKNINEIIAVAQEQSERLRAEAEAYTRE